MTHDVGDQNGTNVFEKKTSAAETQNLLGAKSTSPCSRFEGIFWAAMVGLNYAIVAAFIKFLPEVSIIEFIIFRSVSATAFGLPFLVLYLKDLKNYDRQTIVFWVFISVLNLTYTGTRYTSFQMLPLGDASVIVFSTPLFTAVLSRIFIKEHITRLCIVSLLISLVGMCLTVKLPLILSSSDLIERIGTRRHLIGCAFALTSVINSSIYAIILRRLKSINPALNAFVQGFLSAIMGICIAPIFGGYQVQPCNSKMWIVVVFCVMDFLGNVLYARAMQKEEPTVVTNVVRSSDIFLCFLIQVIIFNDPADMYSVSGALIVFGSGLLMPVQRWMQSLPDESKWKISFLLK